MKTMTDRYGQQLSVGDRVLIAALTHGSARLREGTIRRFKEDRGAVYAGVRTEAGGNTTVASRALARIHPETPELDG